MALGLFERRQRETEATQLLPVELRRLLVTRPDHRPAGAVDSVGDPEPLVVGDAGDRGRERSRDTLEGVAVVVQHNDVPRRVETGTGSAIDSLFGHGGHRRIVVPSPSMSTVALD